MSVIIHYENGTTYKYNGLYVDGCVDWEKGYVSLIEGNCDYYGKEKLDDDVLYVEVRDPESSLYYVYTNPKYDFSVKLDVMTAKARSKANRSDLLSILGVPRKRLAEYMLLEEYPDVRSLNDIEEEEGE